MADKEEVTEVVEVPKAPWRQKETPVAKETPVVKSSGNVIVKYVRGGSYGIQGHLFDSENLYESVAQEFANLLIATGSFVQATESEYQAYNRNKK